MDIHFKNFLLNEESQYFGAKIGDVLNAVQELASDSQNMGSRHLTRLVEQVVNQIRQILRSRWSAQQRPYLEQIQKAGVALMKAIDEQGDLPATLNSVVYELQVVSKKLGTPLNQVGADLD
jgi:hypothetical protein